MLSFIRFKGRSLSAAGKREDKHVVEPEDLMVRDIERTDSWEHAERDRGMRQGFDLATTLERIEKNFVITDPRLPDNPIVRLTFFCYHIRLATFFFTAHRVYLCYAFSQPQD